MDQDQGSAFHGRHARNLRQRHTGIPKQKGASRQRPGVGAVPPSREEALAWVGDGRIHVCGHPDAAPCQAETAQQRPSVHLAAAAVQLAAPNAPVTVTVQTKRADLNYVISPYIYGVNEYGYSNDDELAAAIADAGIRFVRRGGDRDSRYNWVYDTINSASDWYFENYPQSNPGEPDSVDSMFSAVKGGGAEPLFTIPVLGWLPKARDRGCSFSIKKYGAQQSFDQWEADCGNGKLQNGTTISWQDVTDAAALYGPDHQRQFVLAQVAKRGNASAGGIRYYCLDNEPVWWSYVHWDVHPNPSSYNEILERHLAYAVAVKSADPTALILGPVNGGWSDTFFSITDMQHGWATNPWKFYSNPVDRKAHGNVPHLQWYLEQMRAYEWAYGTRLLDIIDIHAYVAGNAGNDATDSASQAQRVAATRTYWDPTFACFTTICDWADPINAPNGVPMFLVRVQQIIDQAYPGLGLALTEYSFGGSNDASGAVAQAEALGIFGKLRLTIATVFSGPKDTKSQYYAFKMYGNYDSMGSQFGSLGVNAVSSNYTAVSAYAAINQNKNTLTVLLINLTPYDQPVKLNLSDITTTKPIKYYIYSSANLTAIIPQPSFAPGSLISYIYPGYSLNMLEVSLS